MSLSEVDPSFRDTSLWFQEPRLGINQTPLGRLFSLGMLLEMLPGMLPEMLPEMLAWRFPVIAVGEGC